MIIIVMICLGNRIELNVRHGLEENVQVLALLTKWIRMSTMFLCVE